MSTAVFKTIRSIWNCYNYEDKAIRGWMMLSTARGPTYILTQVYSASALLFMARSLPSCVEDEVDLGFINVKLSSVLSITAMVQSFFSMILAPLWGSVADVTGSRKLMLIVANILWVGAIAFGGIILFFEISLATFWSFMFSMTLKSVFYDLSILLLFAYLPEITHSPAQLTKINSTQFVIVNMQQLTCAVILAILGFATANVFANELPLTIIAHGLVIIVWLYLGIPGILLIPEQQRARSSSSKSIKELWKAVKQIRSIYTNTGLALAAYFVTYPAVLSVMTLTVAFATDNLGFGAIQIGCLGALILIFSVVGSLAAGILMKKYDMRRLYLSILFVFGIGCAIGPFLVTGREVLLDHNNSISSYEYEYSSSSGCEGTTDVKTFRTREPTTLGYIAMVIFCVFQGTALGLIYPVQTSIYTMLLPKSREATFMGLHTFAGQVGIWLPPLCFTFINEATGNLPFAFSMLAMWFILALPFAWMIDMKKGMEAVHRQDEQPNDNDGSSSTVVMPETSDLRVETTAIVTL